MRYDHHFGEAGPSIPPTPSPRVGFRRRLAITGAGAAIGLLAMFIRFDGQIRDYYWFWSVLVLVAATTALLGAAATRRRTPAIVAATLAAASPFATLIALVA